MNDIELLTLEEVAALLRIDERSVYRKIERGELPGVVKIGNGSHAHIRFIKNEIYNWLQGQVNSTKTEGKEQEINNKNE